MVDDQLTTTKDLKEFFYNKIKQALEVQQLRVSEEVEFYLVNILHHFSLSQNLFLKNAEGRLEDRPLALRLHDAVFDHPDRKFQHLKSLGDTALYQAGVFHNQTTTPKMDIDYYITMGGSAYQSLANMTTSMQKTIADMFCELSEQFAELIEILSLTCEQETVPTHNDLLKLIERYQKTKSQRAKDILEKKGIHPDMVIKNARVQ